MFPIIKKIDDVLPFIQGNDNFSVHKKDDYLIVDYILNTPEMFGNSMEIECRGLIFHANGNIMSRRLHKFFNFNERPETSIENIDFSQRHWILEKLDGSMITAIWTNDKLTWGSKAGVTFLTPQIEEFVEDRPQYKSFVESFSHNHTCIFEWCSRKNRIVIDYPKDSLVLIAIRHTINGEYLSYEDMKYYADRYYIPIVKQYSGNIESMQHLADIIKPMSGIEGFVVRFEDGHMIKIKADEYIKFHRAKNDLAFEKNIISIIVNGLADDFKTLLQDEDKKKFEEFEWRFHHHIGKNAENWFLSWSLCNYNNMTRKVYATYYADRYEHSHELRSIIFKFFDDDICSKFQIRKEIISRIKKYCGSQSGINKVRPYFNGLKWNDFYYQDTV